MAAEARITGAADFQRFSKALKDAGRTELRKELNKGLRDAVKPLIPQTRAEATRRLPQRGGLAKRVAKTPQRVKIATGNNPGVTLLVGKSKSGARSTNKGQVRHPTFGNREKFVTQDVTPGWFDDPVNAAEADIRKAAVAAMDHVVQKILREVR